MAGPMTPAGKLVRGILADEQWHDYEGLVGWLVASGLFDDIEKYNTKNGTKWRKTPRSLAQYTVLALMKQNSYEAKYRESGKRRFVTAVRKKHNFKGGQTLKSCSRCGAHDLDTTQRVRRVIEYRIPTSRTRRQGLSGLGDVIAAKFKTLYLCIPCANEELKAANSTWRIKPPFDYSQGEVRRDASTMNPDGYLRKWGTRSRRKQRRGEHLPEEESRKSG